MVTKYHVSLPGEDHFTIERSSCQAYLLKVSMPYLALSPPPLESAARVVLAPERVNLLMNGRTADLIGVALRGFGSELASHGPLLDGSPRVSRRFEHGGQVVVGAGVARLPGQNGLELGRSREPFA